MRDLKELLGPLSDQEMPDRWDAIQRREPSPSRAPEPRRRSRIPVYAVSVAAAVLVLLVVARLAPLGGGGETAGEPAAAQPPQWLVQLAYEQAYQNGDLTPTSSEWVLSDADAIAPAVGLQSGNPSVEEYLVLLHGQFTAYMAPIPSGTSGPTGHVLSFAVDARTHRIMDWGVSDQSVDVPGLASFLLPDASQTYTDRAGWTVPVPPGWSAQPFDLTSDGAKPIQGSLIGTSSAFTAAGPAKAMPQASGIDFPADGVALAVATTVPNWGGEKTYEPPLSVDDMWQGSAPAGSPSMDSMYFKGPGGWYTMTLKIGPKASPIDISAAAAMVHALSFAPAATMPTAAPTPKNSPPASAVPTEAMQTIGYHGVLVSVPASWAINATTCGTPNRDTVIRDQGGTLTCLEPRPPGVSSVEFVDDPSNRLGNLRVTADTSNANGVSVRLGTIQGRQGEAVWVPDAGVLLMIVAHPAEPRQGIIDSVQLADEDPNGCAMRVTELMPPPVADAGTPSAGSGLADEVVTGSPTTITICHYVDNWLASSAKVTGEQMARLVEVVNGLPRGFAYAPTGSYLPSSCNGSASAGGERGSGYIVHVQGDGTPTTLWAHVGICGPLGITNGVRSGQLTPEFAKLLNAPLHHGYVMPGRLVSQGG